MCVSYDWQRGAGRGRDAVLVLLGREEQLKVGPSVVLDSWEVLGVRSAVLY